MKNSIKNAIIIIIIIGVSIPLAADSEKKAYISIKTGTYFPDKIQDSFTYNLWEEYVEYKGNINAISPIQLGIQGGINLSKRLALQTEYIYYTAKGKGTFSLSFPNPWYYNRYGNINWKEESISFRNFLYAFGLKYKLFEKEKISIYVTGDICYLNAKFKSFEKADITWEYPNKISIENIVYNNESSKTWGGILGIGILWRLSAKYYLNSGVEYFIQHVSVNIRENFEGQNTLKYNPLKLSLYISFVWAF